MARQVARHGFAAAYGMNEPMTDWKKFALLVFALVLVAVVVLVALSIRADLGRML